MTDFSLYNNETIKEKLNRANAILARLMQIDRHNLDPDEIAACDKKEAEIRETIKQLDKAKFKKAMRDADELLGEETKE